MRRLLLVGALTAAAAFGGVASAAPLGDCTGKVDAACDFDPCHPEEGCVTRFCVVSVGKCLVQSRI